MSRFLSLLFVLAFLPAAASASTCVNKYVHQKDGQKVTFTLLTGTLTFDEAKELAASIADGSSEPLVWIGTDGGVVAKQFGPLKVIRPMPVSCDDKPSGVVLQVVFPTLATPAAVVPIRFGSGSTVTFVAQKN